MPRRNHRAGRSAGIPQPLATRRLMDELEREWQRAERSRREWKEWRDTQRAIDRFRRQYGTNQPTKGQPDDR